MTKRTNATNMTTYLLETKNGCQRKVTVPHEWRVTFGPTVPFERKAERYNDAIWALRFYDGKDLKAIFTDVKSFRDVSIGIEEKRVKTQRQTFNKEGNRGGKAVVAEARIEEWINPDDPDTDDSTDYLKLAFDPEAELGE